MLLITYGMENIWLLRHESRKNITYEKIDLIVPERREELLADLRKRTGIDVIEWVNTVKEYGAGEILLTSMDRDGTKEGFDNKLTKAVSSSDSIPVNASGGVGTLQHLVDGIKEGGAEAVLAASIFHFSEFTVQEAKQAMLESGLEVRN